MSCYLNSNTIIVCLPGGARTVMFCFSNNAFLLCYRNEKRHSTSGQCVKNRTNNIKASRQVQT